MSPQGRLKTLLGLDKNYFVENNKPSVFKTVSLMCKTVEGMFLDNKTSVKNRYAFIFKQKKICVKQGHGCF